MKTFHIFGDRTAVPSLSLLFCKPISVTFSVITSCAEVCSPRTIREGESSKILRVSVPDICTLSALLPPHPSGGPLAYHVTGRARNPSLKLCVKGWIQAEVVASGCWVMDLKDRQRGSQFDQNPYSVSLHGIPVTTWCRNHSVSSPGVCLVK